jgi:hypothetical protein
MDAVRRLVGRNWAIVVCVLILIGTVAYASLMAT